MKALLRILRVPLLLEACNVLLHRIVHWTVAGDYVDTISTVLSVAIIFYAGWIASRATQRFVSAVFAGLIVWAFAAALVMLLMTVEVLFNTSLRSGEGSMAIAGFVFSSLLVLPVVIAVTLLAGLAARKRPS